MHVHINATQGPNISYRQAIYSSAEQASSTFPSFKKKKNMKPAVFYVLFAILSLFSFSRAQDRAPHGLVYESPLAFSPQAYDFFHPNTQSPRVNTPLDEGSRSPLSLATTVQSEMAHESVSTANADPETRRGAGGIIGVVLGAAFAVASAIGIYYVVITRGKNLNRTKSAKPAPVQTV